MNNSTLQHFKRYPQLVWTLFNVRHHMEEYKYDYPIVICGGTGNGKSMFQLHLIELWYRVVLGQDIDASYIRYIKNTRKGWVNNFKSLKPLDINSNDEGADGITSKEGMTRFGRDIQRLYMVIRKKLLFTPILIPDYFDLPLYFRKRIRCCIYIPKKGQFKFYTMENLKWVNALNEGKELKRMEVTSPFFSGVFPDYTGVLRKPYDAMSNISADTILDEIIRDIDDKNYSTVDEHFDEVKTLLLEGKKSKEIAEGVGISFRDLTKIKKRMKAEELMVK